MFARLLTPGTGNCRVLGLRETGSHRLIEQRGLASRSLVRAHANFVALESTFVPDALVPSRCTG